MAKKLKGVSTHPHAKMKHGKGPASSKKMKRGKVPPKSKHTN